MRACDAMDHGSSWTNVLASEGWAFSSAHTKWRRSVSSRAQGLSLEDDLVLVRLVADALGAAHVRGVVYRDVNLSNMFLVGGDGARVELLDLGIAIRIGA